MPKLCSFGCKPTESPTHRFPNPDKFPEQFKAWVTLVGGKLESPSDYEYYKNDFIKSKEYSLKRWLCYPSEEFVCCFHDLQNITTSFLKSNVPKRNIKKNITALTDVLVDYPFKCMIHKKKLKEYFTNITINVLIHSWCRSVNRILSGKLNYDGEDETKKAAQVYYNKHKHFKNK